MIYLSIGCCLGKNIEQCNANKTARDFDVHIQMNFPTLTHYTVLISLSLSDTLHSTGTLASKDTLTVQIHYTIQY